MLVMSKGALTAAQAETYYEEKYSQDDYYSEKQQVVGQWFGRGADELGLSGEVTTEDFRSVLRGFRPASAEVLVHKANGYDDRRAGWDATFNAPKSISIQGLVGGDDALIEAHRKAVSRALEELEHYALSRRRGGSEWVVTSNVVAACFDHIAARPTSSIDVAGTSNRRLRVKAWPAPRRRRTSRIARGSPRIIAMKGVSRRNGAHARRSTELMSSTTSHNRANAAPSNFDIRRRQKRLSARVSAKISSAKQSLTAVRLKRGRYSTRWGKLIFI